MWAFDADNFDGDPLRRVTTMECGPFAPKEDPEHDDFAPPSDADTEYERIRVHCAELTAPAAPTEIMQPIDTQITGTKCEVQSDTHVDRVRLRKRIRGDVADPLDSAPKPKRQAFPPPPPWDQSPLLTTAPAADSNDIRSNEATTAAPAPTTANAVWVQAEGSSGHEIPDGVRSIDLARAIKKREQKRRWYWANREKMTEHLRRYYMANRDMSRKYYRTNREAKLNYARKYRVSAVTKQKRRERDRRYYLANREACEKRTERQRRWYLANRDRVINNTLTVGNEPQVPFGSIAKCPRDTLQFLQSVPGTLCSF